MEPQGYVGDPSRSPTRKESPQKQGPLKQKGKKTLAEKQPSELPKAKKRKPLDSDEDDEEPQNDPGTSSNSRPVVHCLFLKDQLQVHKKQLPVTALRMKTVSTATNIVHEVRTPKGHCSTQISTC